jgi:asparagine synthase (glutamine-hydrolysing)
MAALAPVTVPELQAMCATMVHRGPDDEGTYTDGPIGLGHKRLSIIDLSPKGHQPMASSDQSKWITFNGEIYNFNELREELKGRGHQFRTRSDTEVIVHSYEEYGEECLNGSTVCCYWDLG